MVDIALTPRQFPRKNSQLGRPHCQYYEEHMPEQATQVYR